MIGCCFHPPWPFIVQEVRLHSRSWAGFNPLRLVLTNSTLTATPQAAPPTNPTFMEAIMTVYDAIAHRIDITATTKEFHNNAGTVIWKKTVSDDGTTYTEAESASGP